MAEQRRLPSKRSFLAHGIHTTMISTSEECAICLEFYNIKTHLPVKIVACEHHFGIRCLETWVKSGQHSNTCPICRQILFRAETPEADDEHDASSISGESDMSVTSDEDEDVLKNNQNWDRRNDNYSNGSDSRDEEVPAGQMEELQPSPKRRSFRLAERDSRRSLYDREEAASSLLDNTDEFVWGLWIKTWNLVDEAQASTPSSPIKQDSILNAVASLRQLRDGWEDEFMLVGFLVTLARKMIRKHKTSGCFVPHQDLEGYVDHVLSSTGWTSRSSSTWKGLMVAVWFNH
jgi:hypothetical protein